MNNFEGWLFSHSKRIPDIVLKTTAIMISCIALVVCLSCYLIGFSASAEMLAILNYNLRPLSPWRRCNSKEEKPTAEKE